MKLLNKIEKGIDEMNNKYQPTSGGIGFCGALTLMFIAFKLLKVIDWSWLWVFAPLWIPSAIVLAIFLVFVIILVIVSIREDEF